ncbi:MAG: ATP-binding protein [Elusimicrobia bacterium]|nr:ATP-binding protein [Elusimicrobiota bacterium]
MIISRDILSKVESALNSNENAVVIIYGPRQSGKTTLINLILDKTDREKVGYFTGDDLFTQDIFGKNDLETLKRIVSGKDILVIDEAQRIENIGLTIKLIIDNLRLKVLISGSSSFELASKISEPLTGRTKTFWLYPLSYSEVAQKYKLVLLGNALEQMLRFGMYPKVHTLSSQREKEDYLYEYLNNYLYKDILVFESVRKPKKVVDLLTLLSLQIGKEVSIQELAQNLAISQKAVENYLDVLEKMFVIVNLRGFSRNLRKEICKTSKYYFVDAGLRNALIRNFNPLKLRNDAGELFENWFIIEKIKAAANFNKPANFYFWRTYDQQEIDLIEEREGKLMGYECKFSAKKVARPRDWLNAYNNADFKVVDSANFFNYLQIASQKATGAF